MADLFDLIDKNEDRRTRKTKKSLRQSLFKLLETKSINQITVTELAALADINRSTFYIYYNDVYDLLEKIQEEIYSYLVGVVINTNGDFSSSDYLAQYCTKFLEFCKDNYELFRFIVRYSGNNLLADRIKKAIREVVPDSAKAFDSRDPRYYLTTFVLSGFLSTILDWMDDGMRIPVDDMARFLADTYLYGSNRQKFGEYYKQYSIYREKEMP